MISILLSGLGLLDECRESDCVVRSHIREHLAIQIDAGPLQASDEFAVGNLGGPASGIDSRDPQRTEVTLLAASSHEAVAQRLLDGFLCRPVQFAFSEKITRRSGERLLSVIGAVGPAFNSRHVSSP